MIDEESARLLVSEALKDKISFSDQGNALKEQIELFVEIFIETSKNRFSISGLMMNYFSEPNQAIVELQATVSIVDAHEIFALLTQRTKNICPRFSLHMLDKTVHVDGPYVIHLKNITNLNYKSCLCTICFELVRDKQ